MRQTSGEAFPGTRPPQGNPGNPLARNILPVVDSEVRCGLRRVTQRRRGSLVGSPESLV